MIKRISAILLLAFALAACGDSDIQVLNAWLSAFEHGDIETAQRLTSTPAMTWERSADSMAKRTILSRTIVSASDVPPGAQRIRWEIAAGEPSNYMCGDLSVMNGKVKVWQKPLYCTEEGSFDLP